ncbi:MAG: GIY-YIG nuclease family protein [Brumimicrobium sp.]
MEHLCYVLYSKKYEKIYIGYTSNLIGRFKSHNELGKKGYTIRYRPWIVVYLEFYESKSEATSREKQLKSSRGRAWIHSEVLTKY